MKPLQLKKKIWWGNYTCKSMGKTRIWSSLLSIAIVVLLLFLSIQTISFLNNPTKYAYQWWKSRVALEAEILYNQDKVVASCEGKVRVFNLNNGSLLLERKFGFRPSGSPIDVLNGSEWIVYADKSIDFRNETSEMHKVYLLDPNTLDTIMTIDAPYHYHDYQNTWPRIFWEVSSSPNGKLAAFGGVGNLLTVYDVENNSTARVFHLEADAVGRIVWSPDGKKLLVASEKWNNSPESYLELFNIETGELIKNFVKPSYRFAYSPNGSMIAMQTANLTISVFDSSNFEVLYEFNFPLEGMYIEDVIWGSTSKWLAVGLVGCVKIVELESGRTIEKIESFYDFDAMSFSPNDEYLVLSGRSLRLHVLKKTLNQERVLTLVLLAITILISVAILAFIIYKRKRKNTEERE